MMIRKKRFLSAGFLSVMIAAVTSVLAVDITIDESQKFQTIDGLGTFARVPGLYVKAGDFWVERPMEWEIYRQSVDFGSAQPKWFISGACFPGEGKAYDWKPMSAIFKMAREYKKHGITRFCFSVLSPPGWMKKSGREMGIIEQGGVATRGDCYLLPDKYNLMAQFLADFCKAFKDSVGNEPFTLSCQNEPLFTEPYESCVYSNEEMVDLVNKTATCLQTAGLGTKLFGAEDMFMFGTANYGALAWPSGKNQIYAVHGSGSADVAAWANLRALVDPAKALWMSEGPAPATGTQTAITLYSGLKGGNVSGWIYLDYDPLGTYTTTDGINTGWTPNDIYQACKHYFKFAPPASQRIGGDANSADILSLAFKLADNSYTVIVYNQGSSAATLNLKGTGIPTTWHQYLTAGTDKCAYKGTTGSSNISIPASGIMSLKSGNPIPVITADTTKNTLPAPTADNTPGNLNAYGDDILTVWVNGKQIPNNALAGTGSNAISNRAVGLLQGNNVIACYVRNSSWGGGLLASMIVPGANGKMDTLRTDGSWKVIYKDPTTDPTWNTYTYDDSKWPNAKEALDANKWPGFTGWGMMAVNMHYHKSKWILGGEKMFFRKKITVTGATPITGVYARGNNFNYKMYVDGQMVKSGTEFANCVDANGVKTSCLTLPAAKYTVNWPVNSEHVIAYEITDASSDGNGVLFAGGGSRQGKPIGVDSTWWCSPDSGGAGWATAAQADNNAQWFHPGNITAYPPDAVGYFYPADFWFRKKFTSTAATQVLRNLGRVLQQGNLVATRYYDLRGRQITAGSKMNLSRSVLVQRKIFRNGVARESRVVKVR